MEIRTGSVDFSLPLRGNGPRTASQTVIFPRPITSATAGISGYTVAYSGDDHHIGRIEVRLDLVINASTAIVNATFGLRDWSNNWDDDYDGQINFVVLAELESATAPPPRTDLIVTGMELNQAVQFFRASSYLDPANVLPDNAVWPVARKITGIRVYVDWDSSAGLPPIRNLTGSLIVRTGVTTLTLSPINPGNGIIPRRDSEINMAIADQTLNFAIPAAWCVGTVTVTCQVWDQASPASRSAAFTRTVAFTVVRPLNLYLVGINYNAVNPALPAPTQVAISNALLQLIKTYPVGDIIQTGYVTMPFNETVTGNVANGCGSGFNHLLDRLNDLRGGSSDIYLGILPAGIVFNTPGNSIGGCAPQGGYVAAAFLDLPADVPHEVGHALGLHHAPCTAGRCNPPPADPDPNYPQYGTFPSDSIGVFGFDPTNDTVLNPTSNFDFMAYSFPQWVSAYSYNALRGSAFGATGGPSPGGGSHLMDVDIRTLFLGLTISRDRHVTRRPSFNYMAPRLSRSGSSQFTAEFVDRDRRPLICLPLHCDCSHGSCECWPKVIRDQIPMPEDSRWMLVWEGDKKIYEEEITDPPVVKIEGTETQKDGVLLKWSSGQRSYKKNIWYLVQWLDESVKDESVGDWRGVAPRQQKTSIIIPRSLYVEKPEIRIRILATSGIATGVAEGAAKLEDFQPGNSRITLMGIDTSMQKPQPIPNILSILVVDSAGHQSLSERTTWYGENGMELGSGMQFDLRQLNQGRHLLRGVVRGLRGRTLTRSWLVERTKESFLLHNEICDPKPKIVKEDHHHPHPPPEPCD